MAKKKKYVLKNYNPIDVPPRPALSSRITGLAFPKQKKGKKRPVNQEVRF